VNDAGVDAILSKDLRGGGTLTTNLGMLFVGDVHVVSRQHRVNYGLGFDLPVGSQKSRFIAELVGGKFVGPDDPGMANPRSPIDAYAGMRVFPSRWVAVSGAYSLNLRTIEKNVLGVEQTGRHGWVAQVAVQRKINRSPVVECTTDRRTLIEGESTTIKLNAVDPDDDLLTAEWTSTGGRLTQQGNSVIFDSTGLKPGKYIVTAEVSDGENTAVCSSYEVTVEKKKQPPTIACEPRATAIGDSESTTLRAAASDPNGDALAYAWKVDGQSIPNGQAEFVFGAVGKSPGDHKIQVTVTDVDGLSANCEFTVTVRAKPNQPPTVKLKLDKSEVFAGEVVTAVASARDPDGDPINYVWSMDALPRRETGPQIQINSSGMAGGSHAIAVTVSDGRAQTAAASDTSSFVVREKVVIQVGGLKPDNATKARLDEIGLRLQREPRLKAAITGYTDPPKTAKETVKPSLQRAEGAKDYLVKQHQIDPTRIEVRDGGTANPVGDNSTEAGRKENRRVEIVLSVV
jgi:outer membrane protein OmpA-like peptidoglycan-associated protein